MTKIGGRRRGKETEKRKSLRKKGERRKGGGERRKNGKDRRKMEKIGGKWKR